MKVLVVEDVGITCKSFVEAFSRHFKVSQTFGAITGRQALELIHTKSPDYILLDVELPDISGLRIARKILRQTMNVSVVLMSAYADQTTTLAIQDLRGLSGFISKADLTIEESVEVVLSASPWRPFFSESFIDALKESKRSQNNLRKLLNPTERRILSLVAAGLDDEQIGAKIHLTASTIEWKIKQIRQKLNVHSRLDLAIIAQKTGCFRSTWFDLNLIDNYDIY